MIAEPQHIVYRVPLTPSCARSFEMHVEDIRCDIALLAERGRERRIACELAMAERTGIRSVWIHGLWSFEMGRWEAR